MILQKRLMGEDWMTQYLKTNMLIIHWQQAKEADCRK